MIFRYLFLIVLQFLCSSPVWALTLAEQSIARKEMVPLANGDSRIVLDVTLTSQTIATNAGFTLAGTGHVFDTNGFNGKGTGNLLMNNYVNRALLAPQGTLYLKIERSALSFDNSNNGPSAFSDTIGTDNGAPRYAFYANNDAFTYQRRISNDGSGNNGLNFINRASGTTATWVLDRYNSHAVPIYQDSQWTEIIWTWKNLDYWLYVDGHVFKYAVSAASPTVDDFDNFALGGDTAGTNRLGDFYINRLQLSTAYTPPVLLPLRIGLYGDSFVGAALDNTTPGADTIAAIDAIQLFTRLPGRDADYKKTRAQMSWGTAIQSLAFSELGYYLPMYVAAKNGSGWEKSPIPSAYVDAVTAYQPELIIALQSVNDVNVGAPVTNIVANTQATLDSMIDNNSHLRKIIFIIGLNGSRDPTTAAITGWKTEFVRIKNLLKVGLNNYRNIVEVVDLYDGWGGDNYPLTQTIGSAPTNLTSTAGNDQHPSATGHSVIASLVWPYVKAFLLSRPSRE